MLGRLGIWITNIKLVAVYCTYCLCRNMSVFSIIFSSKIIPGNEDKIEQMQEKLRDAGVEVISTEDYVVHASGHATKSQILEMYNLLRPKVLESG